ncbi:hypothetical protein [Megalodesulfovibrio paquesii]
MDKNYLGVTAEMVRRVNAARIARKKTGEAAPEHVDFLGRPIKINLFFDRDEVKRAWRVVRERART